MPGMWLAGRHQMGCPQWRAKTQMQQLPNPVFFQKKGHIQIEQTSMVQEMGLGKDVSGGALSGQRL